MTSYRLYLTRAISCFPFHLFSSLLFSSSTDWKKVPGGFMCRYCDDTRPTEFDIGYHEQEHYHLVKLQCPLCPKRFSTVQSIEAHMDTAHEGLAAASAAHAFPCVSRHSLLF
jgi:hypothetical protein